MAEGNNFQSAETYFYTCYTKISNYVIRTMEKKLGQNKCMEIILPCFGSIVCKHFDKLNNLYIFLSFKT